MPPLALLVLKAIAEIALNALRRPPLTQLFVIEVETPSAALSTLFKITAFIVSADKVGSIDNIKAATPAT